MTEPDLEGGASTEGVPVAPSLAPTFEAARVPMERSTVDSLETAVLEGKLVRVVSWYDNEWGFSNRMVDTASAMGKLG